jgi:hypothetical protein
MPMDPQALAVQAHARVRPQARRQTREWLKACLPAHHEHNVRHDELTLRSPPPRSESAARRQHGTAAANTTHRALSAFHANAAAQRLTYDTPHGMHAAHAHARLTLRGDFERRCWAQAARRVSARHGGGVVIHACEQRAADAAESVPRTTAATTHRQQNCNGALRAGGGVQQTGNAQRSAGTMAH